MPLEISEIGVRIAVGSAQASGGAGPSGGPGPSGGADPAPAGEANATLNAAREQAIVAACVKQVLDTLRQREER